MPAASDRVPVEPDHKLIGEFRCCDPIGPNSELGTYTNFVNLLDRCALAVPGRPPPASTASPPG